MERPFICGGNQYIISPTNTIWLPVSLENLSEEIKVQGYTLYFPSPFHVSLVYVGRIIKQYNIIIPDFVDKIINDFCDFTRTNNIKFLHYNNEYKFVSRDGFKTVVVMCEVSNLNKFFDFINKKYGLNIKYLPTHVTLYNTLKGEPGIYLMDSDDIKNFTVPIPNPIGRSL
ncbi:hypothetical protein A3A05_00920 [Candidatus Nomurabacteria bacterium RIFCSPLOWO2_01_FULL_41_12]|uniref:Uncharacterized protein n=1 Tax=Candidatus Nomurabacteria bacterium RIFCSPLOWO2_01_FULL_41_12 TaxID=1801774 RepID=A0A1F6WVX9_9BACT|nr:MAG: hypothetical protein A2732_01265 [Candidatus Nomurabacteria bacterium RIFCSPHIGHO2_01_FULL_40_10]OGI86037.1 MAG: hypothetical protein A3A05_00920 [Candidatus Nomurabacteria bacterium RIFCSPLOWO2_01_FULL_41_12]